MADSTELPKCGLVMPISEIDGCPESHIISDAVLGAGFQARIVSSSDGVGIIQKNIINNLYADDVVVCDVSCKNPNVMFELGLRLAFDKPTIVVKDDRTNYSFDTSPIEHLTYPRDLRFSSIVDFKEALQDKVKHTYEAAKDPNFKGSFLKSFGDFIIAKIETTALPRDQFIMEELKALRSAVEGMGGTRIGAPTARLTRTNHVMNVSFPNPSTYDVDTVLSIIRGQPGVNSAQIQTFPDGTANFIVETNAESITNENFVRFIVGQYLLEKQANYQQALAEALRTYKGSAE